MVKTRSANIELLRIISMIMVVVLHFFYHGEILRWTTVESSGYLIYWSVEALAFVAVNVFVLISGYFLCLSRFKLSRIISTWIQVLLYSILCTIVCMFIKEEYSLRSILQAIVPLTTNQYWFATSYMMMLCLSPFLNIALNHMTRKEHVFAIGGALFLFSIMPTFLVWERKLITNGMDFIWFCVLYIIAAYIRKYGLLKNVIHKWYLYGYILCSFVLALFRLPLSFISMHVGLGDKLTGILYSYNSVFVVVSSVLLFSFFLHVHVDNDRIKSIILKVSPLTFAVYLIHDHPMVRSVLWSSLPLRQWFDGGILETLAGMLISVISIFVICCLVDKCRMVLFYFLGIEIKIKKLDAMWQKFIV